LGSLSWSKGGKKTGFVDYKVQSDKIILYYRFRENGGEWEAVVQELSFDWTSCHYGGHRVWFRCPQCARRIAILYGAGRYFLCRHCYNLTYSCQREGQIGRLIRKAQKLRKKLGSSGNLAEPIWEKPKNMHNKTFFRLSTEAEYSSDLSLQLMDLLL
jgi:hypothetical protein